MKFFGRNLKCWAAWSVTGGSPQPNLPPPGDKRFVMSRNPQVAWAFSVPRKAAQVKSERIWWNRTMNDICGRKKNTKTMHSEKVWQSGCFSIGFVFYQPDQSPEWYCTGSCPSIVFKKTNNMVDWILQLSLSLRLPVLDDFSSRFWPLANAGACDLPLTAVTRAALQCLRELPE